MNKQLRPTDPTELMNTKQAAQFLNVSEISIRRWTESGKLPCVRVGARRERRFDKTQLIEFLKDQDGTNITHTLEHSSKPVEKHTDIYKSDHVNIEGMQIPSGQHLCTLYKTDVVITKLSVPFLAQGIKNRELCVLVATKTLQKIIIDQLSRVYPAAGTAIDEGELILSEGISNPDELYQYFENIFLTATRHGYSSIRVLGDMGWTNSKNMSFDDLMLFERDYNHNLCPSFPVVSLCQYDARSFSGTEILQALNNHKDTFNHSFARFIGH